jgi:AbiV family abortive infection protein
MKKEMIPHEKLEEGIEKCRVQAKYLFDSAEILLKKKRYATAISLLILAREELTKVKIFSMYNKAQKPIDNEIWKSLTTHATKLGTPYVLAYERLRKLSINSVMDLRKMIMKEGVVPVYDVSDQAKPIDLERVAILESFDFLKQDCQFVNWVNDDWFSILENYNKKLQEDISTILYYDWLGEYYVSLLSIKFKKGDPIEIPHTITGNKYRKILKHVSTLKFRKLRFRVYEKILSDFKPRHDKLMEKRVKELKQKLKTKRR